MAAVSVGYLHHLATESNSVQSAETVVGKIIAVVKTHNGVQAQI
jgi:hypothetical protein